MTRTTVILGASRFGAGLFLDTVASQYPDTLVIRDLFQPGESDLEGVSELTGETRASVAARAGDAPHVLWGHILTAAARARRDVVARAFYYHQPRNSPAWAELAATSRIVHVVRSNLFDAYLSRQTAERSGVWKATRRADVAAETEPAHLDRARLQQFVRERSEQVRWARRRFCAADYHEVMFDEIASGPEACKRVAARVLGRQSQMNAPATQGVRLRIRRRSNADLVANYDEVADLDRAML